MKLFYNKEIKVLVLETESRHQYAFDVPNALADVEMESLSKEYIENPNNFFNIYSLSDDWEMFDTDSEEWKDYTEVYLTDH